MAKTLEQIAADLDELADAIEQEAADYRRTAASLRRRAGVQPEAVQPKARQRTDRPSMPGGSQSVLLAAYRVHGTDPISVDQLVETAKSQGHSVTKQAAQAANNRMLKNGAIERVGHGRYRERQETFVLSNESPALNGAGSVHAEDGG